MLGAELTHILLTLGKQINSVRYFEIYTESIIIEMFVFLGEKLTEQEVEEVQKDCLDPEDDEGMVPYVRKYSPKCFDNYIYSKSIFLI